MNTDEIIRIARAQGLPETEIRGVFRVNADDLGRILAAEREACAKVAAEPQGWALPRFNHAPSDRTIGRIEGEKEMSYRIAAAIRARGQ